MQVFNVAEQSQHITESGEHFAEAGEHRAHGAVQGEQLVAEVERLTFNRDRETCCGLLLLVV
jgi:hypothetical protein